MGAPRGGVVTFPYSSHTIYSVSVYDFMFLEKKSSENSMSDVWLEDGE